MKAMVVVGTRPEAIKLAPVIAALGSEALVVTTGQHAELAAAALADFGIAPQVALKSPTGVPGLSRLAAHVLAEIDALIGAQHPDWVVVQGDTSSAFSAGLAAFHRQVPLAHVEAGLRTGRLDSPFPEEGNRAMLARIARLSFAPTRHAEHNLVAEGIGADRIVMAGNTVVDAVALAQAGWTAPVRERLAAGLDLGNRKLVVVTCHRRESFGVLEEICAAIRTLAHAYRDHLFVVPVHPNPQVRNVVEAALAGIGNVRLTAPLGYHEMLYAVSRAELVLTDSGGLQEEVAAFHRPVVVLRDVTERPEGIEAGFATLAGREPERIVTAARVWLDQPERRQDLEALANPYGDGKAAARIVAALRRAIA